MFAAPTLLEALEWFARNQPAIFGFVFGAAIASFLCVVAERVPAGESINGRSHCICGQQLKARHNVPILGWLALRGRAKCCGASIPVIYVLAEISLAIWMAVALASLGVNAAGLGACVLGMVVLVTVVGYAARRRDERALRDA